MLRKCEWNDRLCHGIWTAQRNRRVWYAIPAPLRKMHQVLSSHLEHPANSYTLQGLSTTNMRIITSGNEHAKHATTRGRVVYSRHAGFQHLGAGQHGYWVCGDMWGDYLSRGDPDGPDDGCGYPRLGSYYLLMISMVSKPCSF